MTPRPILYSFRRCPYAMRARLAIASSNQPVQLREIVLRDKTAAFLEASPKGTVPVVVDNGQVIEESLDVMLWALNAADPESLLEMPEIGFDLIAENDGPFKTALDRTKYHVRYEDADPLTERQKTNLFLEKLDALLQNGPWLFGDHPTLADFAILPFIRQFSNVDRTAFDAQGHRAVSDWLDRFLASERFTSIMSKYAKWEPGAPETPFPG